MPRPRSLGSNRIAIRLPSWHLRKLQLWAWAKGVSVTTLSQNILQARIEANEQQIMAMIAENAAAMSKSSEQLINEILAKD